MNLHSFYDAETHKTKYWIFCSKCGKHYYTCLSPKSALRAAVNKGFDLETGTCKVCHVMTSMQPLIEKRSAA
jgi:hypothetical protein